MANRHSNVECCGLTQPCRWGGLTPLERFAASSRGDEGGVKPPHSKAA